MKGVFLIRIKSNGLLWTGTIIPIGFENWTQFIFILLCMKVDLNLGRIPFDFTCGKKPTFMMLSIRKRDVGDQWARGWPIRLPLDPLRSLGVAQGKQKPPQSTLALSERQRVEVPARR